MTSVAKALRARITATYAELSELRATKPRNWELKARCVNQTLVALERQLTEMVLGA
ncbi:MAG: hypothetical protein FWD69_10225 [Polyangiaceae bacterium]|nr:hypothetical protein [Polyangiaceae bacterium]